MPRSATRAACCLLFGLLASAAASAQQPIRPAPAFNAERLDALARE